MPTIDAAGFSDSPPVSKVMPLPTSAMCRDASAGSSRGGPGAGAVGAPPHAEDAAEALLGEVFLVEDLDRDVEVGDAVGSALGELGRALPLGGNVHEVLDEGDGVAEDLSMLGVLVVEGGVQGDPGGASLALLRAVPVEFVSAEHCAFCCRRGVGLQAVGEGDGDVLETGEGA